MQPVTEQQAERRLAGDADGVEGKLGKERERDGGIGLLEPRLRQPDMASQSAVSAPRLRMSSASACT
jgi:hypothetical protein